MRATNSTTVKFFGSQIQTETYNQLLQKAIPTIINNGYAKSKDEAMSIIESLGNVSYRMRLYAILQGIDRSGIALRNDYTSRTYYRLKFLMSVYNAFHKETEHSKSISNYLKNIQSIFNQVPSGKMVEIG